ncbi:flagellar basal body M-ring protein FliF [Massilia arenosa]|uniref:Flagellar M-ring protein n=1 Tax=Zemynaea arenosa TaxID=2561931 RepID=A0A4Y9SUP8_9BURK|nr:flagellar basal-body MS-ring/collar protein FliF [Massilia arenosa]TFW30185.1 flagellar basal body M-ring protein FliF [Massilia arenosa]
MAVADDTVTLGDTPDQARRPGFLQTTFGRNIMLGAGIAVVIAIMAGVWMWSQQPDYRVLFSNYSDRDGGAITAALDQMGVPHKFSEGGAAILVPANQVHDVRLKLASQGLPKGGNVGFEIMENQKLGISQFLEQVNYQRSLEGELARSIESVAAVASARVHLAMPKPSVFVREQQKPTASVLLNLQPGRALDPAQVQAIVHLVASSVPELTTGNVTVVDQNGNLLSETSKQAGKQQLDPNQLKYVAQLQANIVRQVESIVTPLVGDHNVRAEATADIDFAQTDTASEAYKPNSPPNESAIRSQQTSEANGPGSSAAGVPGALSNQPPGTPAAPINAAPGSNPNTAAVPGAAGSTGPSQKNSTTNFEVDKTVKYEQKGMGGIKRLTVGVVVNYRRIVDPKTNKVTVRPLTAAEIQQINDLVKEAMGFSQERGDTVKVTNLPFDGVDRPVEVPPEVPWWKNPDNWSLAKEIGKFLIAFVVMSYLFFRILRPMLKPIFRKLDEIADVPPPPPPPPEPDPEDERQEAIKSQLEEMEAQQAAGYRENLQMAKNLAKEDPRIVANVVKAWVGSNE